MEMEIQPRALACREYETLLADYVLGECAPVEASRVDSHLRGCRNCHAALEEARAGSNWLRVGVPLLDKSPEPRPEFARLTMARIRSEAEQAGDRSGFWQPFVVFAWRFAATAMVALVILLTYAVRGHYAPRTAAGLQGPLADVFAPDPTRVPANQDEILIMVAETDHANGND